MRRGENRKRLRACRWRLRLAIPDPRAWSPADPHLYDLTVRLVRGEQVLDEVGSYFAMRKFELGPDAAGHLRFTLNNQPLFLYGPLDQGYFPDGLYTPPSEEAMLYDIEYTRRIGCNLIRKHIKVEPLRWYYRLRPAGHDRLAGYAQRRAIDGDVVAFLALSFDFRRDDTCSAEALRAGEPGQPGRIPGRAAGHARSPVQRRLHRGLGAVQRELGPVPRQRDGGVGAGPTTRPAWWITPRAGSTRAAAIFQSKHIYFKKL